MKTYRHLIDVADLRRELDAADCRVIDCRFDLMHPEQGRAEYLAGHVPGAVYADLDRDLAGPVTDHSGRHPLPDPAVFKATLERFGIADDTQVVVYDHAGGAVAARLWWLLRWIGHTRVAILDGGFKAWSAAGERLETDVPRYSATELPITPDPGLVATSDEIAASLDEGRDPMLVDARDRARFAGEREPIDTVAGHIPGALNFPFSENLDGDGRWKAPGELRRMWAALLASESPPPFVVMCGSGVTACHLVLSAEVAGFRAPRVYVGSWSEWIRDPARPVAGGDATRT